MIQQRHLTAIALLTTLLGFQNCSQVNFDDLTSSELKPGSQAQANDLDLVNDDTGDHSGGNDNRDDENPTKDHLAEDEILDEVISKNRACDLIFDGGTALDLNGQDFNHSGVSDELHLKNVGTAKISGTTLLLSVNGAASVTVSGAHRDICLKGEHITVSGTHGRSEAPLVFVGTGANATLNALSGNGRVDVVVLGMKDIRGISGTNRDIYIHSGNIDSISGNGNDIYLMNNSKLKRLSGNYRNVYLFNGSSVERKSGSANLIAVD